jgi:glucose-6-phosphate isomerase
VGRSDQKSPADHFVAVSTNAPAMDAFGIAPTRRFTMWDWVGGRYSVWSAVGLIAELTLGSERFANSCAVRATSMRIFAPPRSNESAGDDGTDRRLESNLPLAADALRAAL